MKNLKIQLAVIILVVFAGGSAYIVLNSPNTGAAPTTPEQIVTPPIIITSVPAPIPVSAVKSYSLSDIALHSSAVSCWTAVRGNVYNLTPWIKQHPGGAIAILSLCGRDGTSEFINQHSGQRQPEAELKSFLIGILK